ncbi:hypothetical protein C3L33_06303, partial [Rhododendron williamsianum]
MSRTRKTRRRETTAVDRISECPDSVLVHILSLLEEIEDAVRTQVLSKRWRFLWTFLPSLVFRYTAIDDYGGDGEDFGVARNSEFVAFVEKTLFSSDCKLRKFEVDFHYEPRFASNVDSWTRFVAGKGVEELYLLLLPELGEDGCYELPQLLYDNYWFKELHFSCCRVIPRGNVACPCLYYKVLSIMEAKGLSSPLLNCNCLTLDTKIDKYVLPGIANVFKSSPNVEAVIMTWSFSSSELTGIRSTGLLNYNEEQYWTSQKWTYKCLTLHLKNVTISDDLMRYHCDSNLLSFVQFLLRNARVLQKMVISMRSDDRLKECFEAAKKLISFPRSSPDAAVIFCTGAIEVLSIMEAKGLSSPLLNCKCLTLDTKIDKYVLPGIANLFKTTPNVEALIMASSSSSSGRGAGGSGDGGEDGGAGEDGSAGWEGSVGGDGVGAGGWGGVGAGSPESEIQLIRRSPVDFEYNGRSPESGDHSPVVGEGEGWPTVVGEGLFKMGECRGRRLEFTVLLNYNEEQYWASQKWTYKCLTLHLKNVTISDDLMRYHCDSNLLSFVQFLLGNARVLQKMVISTRSDDRLKECFEAAKKLLSFPRSSPDAAVIFS